MKIEIEWSPNADGWMVRVWAKPPGAVILEQLHSEELVKGLARALEVAFLRAKDADAANRSSNVIV